MTIGELLKEKRLAAAKTQKEWVGSIISPSYYAKVEKDRHRLAAADLLAILKHNHLSLADFFQDLEDEENHLAQEEENLNHQVIQAVYNDNLTELNYLIRMIQKSKWPQAKKDKNILQIKGMIEDVKLDLDSNYQPNKTVVQELKDKIFSIPNFTALKLELYGNFINFYDYQTNIMITKSIIPKIKKTTSVRELFDIEAILSNLLSQLVEARQYQQTLPFLRAADEIPTLPQLYFAKTGIALHRYVIKYHFSGKEADLEKAELIAKSYRLTGLKQFGQSAQKFIEQEKRRVKMRRDHQ